MKRISQLKAVGRAAAIVSAVTVIVTGVTFAALQSQQAVLKGNTIQTAVANLQLSSDGKSYGNSLAGYTFSGLVPGGQPAPVSGYPIYLQNAGSTPLALKLSIGKAVTNPNNVDLSKVHVILAPFSGGTPQNITMQDLITSADSGGTALSAYTRLPAGQNAGYEIQVMMEADAVTGPGATLSDVDFVFGAGAVN